MNLDHLISNNIRKYIFVTIGSFPYGNASTNRMLSYSRGLTEIGYDVSILVLSPDYDSPNLKNKRKSTFKEIKILYTCPLLQVKSNIVGKINLLIGLIYGYIYLFGVLLFKREQLAVSLVFTQSVPLYFYLKLTKCFNVKVFHERTEFPFIGNKKYLDFYLKRIVPLFDGIYVISFSLVDYFKNLTDKPVQHLPMTVELDRFLGDSEKNHKYIAYCGTMYTDKDGVPDLIEAFNLVAGQLSDWYLYLIGDNSDLDKFKIINKKIEASPYKARIICTGYIGRDEIPQLLMDARILALCRPDNMQAKGGFPTKLGEYLATSNPVIITDVGDHTKYLTDGKSAYIAEPNNPQYFANKIIECVHDEVRAVQIGKNGYLVAQKHFNYLTQAKSLHIFLESIK